MAIFLNELTFWPCNSNSQQSDSVRINASSLAISISRRRWPGHENKLQVAASIHHV